MGTWGPAPFENDDALDFVREVVEDGPVALEEAFDVVLDAEGLLEAPEGARAVAAAALLGGILTGEHAGLPQEAGEWLAQQPPEGLAGLRAPALTALDIVEGPSSELRELWEAGAYEDWRAQLRGVRERLVAPAPS